MISVSGHSPYIYKETSVFVRWTNYATIAARCCTNLQSTCKRVHRMTESKPSDLIQVPMNWQDDRDMTFPHVDNVFVRRMGGVFHLTFGRAALPLKVHLEEADIAQLRTKGVPVIPVTSVTVTGAELARIAKILSQLVDISEGDSTEVEISGIEMETGNDNV